MAPVRGRGGFRRGLRREIGHHPTLSKPETTRDVTPSEHSQSDSDDEEEAQPIRKAYSQLLKTLSQRPTHHGQPRHKRRKIQDALPETEETEETEEPEEPVGDDILSDASTGDEPAGVDEDIANPYKLHIEDADEAEIQLRIKRMSDNQWASKKIDFGGGRGMLQVPSTDENALDRRKIKHIRQAQLKGRLVENAQREIADFSNLEQAIVPSVFGYQDLLFGARTVQNAARLRDITCLHALNHILCGRDRILKNTAKLSAAGDDLDTEFRDQGFTRPKILFLLETKQACVRVLESITKLYNFEQQENKKRFLDSFSITEQKFSDDRPADFRELFEGNDENEFRIGIKLTRKTLKLFSTFYTSDIILASALGLRRAIESGDPKKRDYDFLSSIEMVIMEQADATLMQNWDHAEFVFEHLNLQPKDAHGCDFSRVRPWYLDDHAKHIRQTIVLSAFLTPKINTLYNKHMRNIAGRLKYTADYTSGLIESLPYGIKQTFLRFDSPSHLTDPDARFKHFSSTILPSTLRIPKPLEGGVGVVVFIPSYLDFVRVRNSLVDTDIAYASISEYTDATDVRKARSHFMNGKHSLLLYTGRAHHFHRYNLRGVKRVVFYGVPENPVFYEEIVGFVGKTIERGEISKAEANVRVCFSKWERMELERIVGTKRVGKMIGDKGDVFDFV